LGVVMGFNPPRFKKGLEAYPNSDKNFVLVALMGLCLSRF